MLLDSASLFDFNPRPPRGGRQIQYGVNLLDITISIHALREEGDCSRSSRACEKVISIHALREEGDANEHEFESFVNDFNPRPPRGGRRVRHDHTYQQGLISIHALREESDRLVYGRQRRGKLISIHALREESDKTSAAGCPGCSYFNPRPPRGGRRGQFFCFFNITQFQSTPSARRATLHPALEACFIAISIHALREEDDRKSSPGKAGHRNFNPRPPRGERPAVESLPEPDGTISIHALRGESDVFKRSGSLSRRQFQSTPSARRATKPVLRAARVAVISIHALREEGDGGNSFAFSI